jgi:hypothetical protein
MRHIRKRLGALTAGMALLSVAACGGGGAGDQPAAQETRSTPQSTTAALRPQNTGDPFADARTAASHMPGTAKALATGIAQAANTTGDIGSPAADLRAGLTHLMQEHVYLAGIAVATAYETGADSPEFKTAAQTVDANSKDVAAAVGSVAGKDNEEAFLQSWRSHVNDFVSYAVAAKGKDAAGKKQAVDNLMAYATSQGEFFNKITNGALPVAAVQMEFETHIGSLAKAVDAFAAGDKQGYHELKQAAEHMPTSAKALSGGIVQAAKIEGDPNDAASELRSNLTSMLNSHVYLACISVFTAYTAGTDSAAFKAAAAALDVNSAELSKAIGSVAGPDNEKTFLQVWRQHIENFVSYAVGAAKGDEKVKQLALSDLDAYRSSAGAFFEKVTKGALTEEAVAAELRMHIETLAGAIDSMKQALVK